MAYDHRALSGVGGWLAFFIITLALTAAGSLLQAVAGGALLAGTATAPGSAAYGGVVLAIGLLRAGGYGFLIWRLNWRQVPSTPRLVIIGLWVLALVPSLVDALAAGATGVVDSRIAAQAAGAAAARPIVYAAIWTAYLLRSERVANTYTPDTTEADRLAAVFD